MQRHAPELNEALRRSPDVAWQTIGGEAVLMNLAPEGRVLGLNPAGSLVWSMLEEHDYYKTTWSKKPDWQSI